MNPLSKPRSSPRPTFDGPAHIPYEKAVRHVWGDKTSGEVDDWIYVSSGKVHALVFGLEPGGAFRHSEAFRTIFAADEVFYVLSGTLALSNPQTGEVHRAERGEAVFFRRDTWHHGFNVSPEPLRVLELFAPPPLQGASSAYAQTKPMLKEVSYTQDRWLGRWPEARPEAEKGFTMRVLADREILWRLEGRERQVLVGILASTEQLTAGKIHLLPGQQSEVHTHGGDEFIYLTEGALAVRASDSQAKPGFDLKPGDGFYVPQGTPHQYANVSDRPATAIFGVAPNYFPE